ncbi:MAG: Crp/Fnr family transcriptional regulator [Clostridium sp.]|nr:Crp/Fnr family transcriptional regulator [Clostridium sp.]
MSDSDVILSSMLFRGVKESELPEALDFLKAVEKMYRKNAMIFMIGDPVRQAGLVLEGMTELSFLDEDENSVNMNHFSAGNTFGLSLAFVGTEKSPNQMQALTDCRILFLNLDALSGADAAIRPFQARIMANLLHSFAQQNVFLSQKVRIMGQHRLRDRIKVYLQQQRMAASEYITLRFNRNELAGFLGVNRSALSRELSHLQEEGILTVEGRRILVRDRSFLSGT